MTALCIFLVAGCSWQVAGAHYERFIRDDLLWAAEKAGYSLDEWSGGDGGPQGSAVAFTSHREARDKFRFKQCDFHHVLSPAMHCCSARDTSCFQVDSLILY